LVQPISRDDNPFHPGVDTYVCNAMVIYLTLTSNFRLSICKPQLLGHKSTAHHFANFLQQTGPYTEMSVIFSLKINAQISQNKCKNA